MAEITKDILIYILTGIIAIISYFGKNLHKDFKEMQKDIELLKKELSKVENESKRYWSENKLHLENNQKLVLERINHISENNKAGMVMIKEMFEHIEKNMEKRFERLENKK